MCLNDQNQDTDFFIHLYAIENAPVKSTKPSVLTFLLLFLLIKILIHVSDCVLKSSDLSSEFPGKGIIK